MNRSLLIWGGAVSAFAVLTCLLWSGIQSLRDDAWRSTSANNLKQLGLAAHNYHEQSSRLPLGTTIDAAGRAHFGWPTRILPYLDASPTYSLLNHVRPWDDPENILHFRMEHHVFTNPAESERFDSAGLGLSHYAASSAVMGDNSSTRMNDLKDGAAHTILFGEIGEAYQPWGSPRHVRDPAAPLNRGPDAFGRPGGAGAYLCFADGSVRFVSSAADAGYATRRSASRSATPAVLYRIDSDSLSERAGVVFQIGSDGVVKAAWLPGYAVHYSDRAEITDADLEAVAGWPQLEYLQVTGKITDDGLKTLRGLKQLRVLRLRKTQVTAAGVRHFQTANPHCRVNWTPPE